MKSTEKSKKAGKVGREELITAIRAAVEAGGGGPLGYKKFLAVAKMTKRDLWRNFPKWNDALKAAGYVFNQNHRRVPDVRLLTDWGRLARKLGRAPLMKEYAMMGEFHESVLQRRFGGPWGKVIDAFRNFALKDEHWLDVMALLPEPGYNANSKRNKTAGKRQGTRSERLAKSRAFKEDRQISGDPLYLEGISHAPVNETGVIMLFGAMAAKLGFMVESVRANFPDCQAKRRIGPDAWLTLRIEFEYESRNFRDHGHPVDGCDMIVCWVHNWADCPSHLKVIALSEELARLRRERMMLAF